MSEYKSSLVKCPFYKEETKNTIRCEGAVSETLQNNFERTNMKKAFRREYCCLNFEHCPLNKAISEKQR